MSDFVQPFQQKEKKTEGIFFSNANFIWLLIIQFLKFVGPRTVKMYIYQIWTFIKIFWIEQEKNFFSAIALICFAYLNLVY